MLDIVKVLIIKPAFFRKRQFLFVRFFSFDMIEQDFHGYGTVFFRNRIYGLAVETEIRIVLISRFRICRCFLYARLSSLSPYSYAPCHSLIRYGSHDKVCKLRKQTFVRTDIMHVTEHSIFNIQNLFQLAHFPGTERVLGYQGLFDFVIYAEVPRQCELNKFICIALGFRVYLQHYP